MKRFILLFQFLTSVSFLFIACNKTDSTERLTTGGTVVSYPSKQPLAGVKVYLIRQGLTLIYFDPSPYWSIYYLDTLIEPPKYKIDSTISDTNGKFSFVYSPESCQGCNGVYRPVVLDPNYVTVGAFVPKTRDTIFLDHPSYFRLNMHKTSPASIVDTLFENRDFLTATNSYPAFPTHFRKAQVGQTNTTIIDTFSYNATSKVAIEWRHYKNGLQTSGIDTINLIPNSTTVLNISY